MDKVTRLLLMYSRLIRGEKINKLNFCMETDSMPRTFDRDIEDIRLYLSEMFYNEELIYERQENVYYFSNSQRKTLEDMEYLFVERVLLDAGVLRSDEMDGLLTHLASNTENPRKMVACKTESTKSYKNPYHNKAILKIHGDLTTIITNKAIIKINYMKMNGEMAEREVVPCTIKYDLGYLYLIAFIAIKNKQYPAYFRLDRIHSFSIVRSQRADEIQRVNEYNNKYLKGVTQMYGGDFIEIILSCKKEFYPYIYDKFKHTDIVQDKGSTFIIKINTFTEGFIKWMLSQSIDLVQILEPQQVKDKIIDKAKKLVSMYTEVHK